MVFQVDGAGDETGAPPSGHEQQPPPPPPGGPGGAPPQHLASGPGTNPAGQPPNHTGTAPPPAPQQGVTKPGRKIDYFLFRQKPGFDYVKPYVSQRYLLHQ